MISYLPLAKKVNQFTYGLLYPAFFGNMVYDLILSKTDSKFLQSLDFFTGLLILLFYVLDYMHLYVDVENSGKKKVENKTWRYIGCDIFTSLLIFFAFVFLKKPCYGIALLLAGFIPGFIAWYKYEQNINDKHKTLLLVFAVFSALSGVIGFFFHKDYGTDLIFVMALVQLLVYSYYVFFYYPKNAATESKS